MHRRPSRDAAVAAGPWAATRPTGRSPGEPMTADRGPHVEDRDEPREDRRTQALSPAVGVFRPGLAPGARVRQGDRVAVVDQLGIPVDVTVPDRRHRRTHARRGGRRGRVRRGPRRGRAPRGRRLMFKRDLIANRGEIALRVLRACRTLGVEAVVAYSEADRESLPVQLADEAICIGPADARRSYLSAPAIISAAVVTGCDAIHPGYGFLSRGRWLRRCRPRPRPDVHRPAAGGAGALRIEGGHAPAAGRPGSADDPGLGLLARRPARAGRGRSDRLPGARQAVGGRRRQGDADGPLPARAGERAAGLPLRGARGVR